MVRISEAEARALGLASKASKKPSKYRNEKPTYYDKDLKESLRFDSNKELNYYLILKDRQKKGEITDLKRQVTIEILPAFTDVTGAKHRALTYVADFTYTEVKTSSKVIVDVKGFKTEVYKIKRKLLAYKGIIIKEV